MSKISKIYMSRNLIANALFNQSFMNGFIIPFTQCKQIYGCNINVFFTIYSGCSFLVRITLNNSAAVEQHENVFRCHENRNDGHSVYINIV